MTYREERPWGWFEILYEEKKMKVKRILVKPKSRLSYQSHQHRSENWVVIKGRALVTLENRLIPLKLNQSLYIPARAKHRIENRGKDNLIFIEVQTGTYLGEDDIVRFSDDYHRC